MEFKMEVAETYITGTGEEIRILDEARETKTQRDNTGNYEQYTGYILFIGDNGLKYYHDGVAKHAKKEKFNIIGYKVWHMKI